MLFQDFYTHLQLIRLLGFSVYHFPNMCGNVYEYLYPLACRLTLHSLESHLLLSWAASLASANVNLVHWMMVSFHCILGLPLPLLPSNMPSLWSHCREECLMMGPKINSFFYSGRVELEQKSTPRVVPHKRCSFSNFI